jgi:histidinol-phosphatase (PHP family)
MGSMEGSCARALELGLPSIAFTEHVDQTRWYIPADVQAVMATGDYGATAQRLAARVGPDQRVIPAPFDIDGYLAAVERCRARFPGLRILTGVEMGEPHWFAQQSAALLRSGVFDRVLGSLHSLELAGERREFGALFRDVANGLAVPPVVAADAVRAYLTELVRMVESSSVFAILAHIDYPVRRWPVAAGEYAPTLFEEEFRAVLRVLAQTGRALEVNTRIPLHPLVVRWWHEAGGDAVSFGSDAHLPAAVADGFAEAAAMVEAQGFRPGRAPHDFWTRALVT